MRKSCGASVLNLYPSNSILPQIGATDLKPFLWPGCDLNLSPAFWQGFGRTAPYFIHPISAPVTLLSHIRRWAQTPPAPTPTTFETEAVL